ncbi:SGNH/GDSL hydrolase family protein, partial [Streptomyces sp. NPDC058286]
MGVPIALALTLVPFGTASAATTPASSSYGKGTRVSAWSPSMTTGGPAFDDQTIRMVVHSSVAGSGARITLSNRY